MPLGFRGGASSLCGGYLPRPIQDAHAAAVHFFQELLVAELAGASECGLGSRSVESMDMFRGPIWASHSRCGALVPHIRQFADKQITLLTSRGAVGGCALEGAFGL